jgi:hypothetical protein
VSWEILRFKCTSAWWGQFAADEFSILATGYLSNNGEELQGFSDSSNPNLPVNRLINLSFSKYQSEGFSHLLNVNFEPWGGNVAAVEGSPEDPWVPVEVSGYFDPMGIGEMNFNFKLGVNSQGRVFTDQVRWTGHTNVTDDFDIDALNSRGIAATIADVQLCAENAGIQCEDAGTFVLVDFT